MLCATIGGLFGLLTRRMGSISQMLLEFSLPAELLPDDRFLLFQQSTRGLSEFLPADDLEEPLRILLALRAVRGDL